MTEQQQQQQQQQTQQPQTQQQAVKNAMNNPAAFVAPAPQPQNVTAAPPMAPGILSFNTTAPEPQQQQQQQPNAAYDSIIAQQQAQIEALINQNNNLTQQVTQMVQNGAQFQQQPQQQQFAQAVPQPQPVQFPNVYQPTDTQAHPLSTFNPPALADDQDFSLEGLASEIGKRGNNG